jgi:MIP family channel proteins
MMQTEKRQPWQRYLAELIGTFAIVFAACGAVISDVWSNGAVTLLGIALAPGLMVMAMVYTFGGISAAHYNPAVTLAFAAAGRFPRGQVLPYLVAQLIGALLASLAHSFFYPAAIASKAHFGAHLPNVGWGAGLAFELVITFFLMIVIMAVATDKRTPAAASGLAIGVIVILNILVGAAVTGGSMNPFRSLAPAIFAGGAALSALPIYLLGPTAGAILAALCYETLRDDLAHAQSAPADLDVK